MGKQYIKKIQGQVDLFPYFISMVNKCFLHIVSLVQKMKVEFKIFYKVWILSPQKI
jgi:hypothetical protein